VNLVDSSGWLEYLADGPGADFFAPAIEEVSELLVPTICIVEVAKIILRQRGEQAVLQSIALMQQGRVADLDVRLAESAAALGVAHRLPLADSIILATARAYEATLWTQDGDFKGLENVRYTEKR